MTGKTYAGLLREAGEFLAEKGIAESSLDAWYLFSDCFSMDRARYFLEAGNPIPEEKTDQILRLRAMLEKRGARIPLQQILGVQEFMGLEFLVNDHVLIPRQDTETLVEEVLSDVRRDWMSERMPEGPDGHLALWDLCTGSGCIGLSLIYGLRQLAVKVNGTAQTANGAEAGISGTESAAVRAVLSDISGEALAVAKKNADRLGLSQVCSFVCADLFEGFGQAEKQPARFDILVSNPPYIPSRVIEGLEPEVREHEPRLALDGHEDGLFFYREIAREAGRYLVKDGRIYVETGWDQGEHVKALFEAAGFTDVEIIKDLSGNDRVVKGRNGHV